MDEGTIEDDELEVGELLGNNPTKPGEDPYNFDFDSLEVTNKRKKTLSKLKPKFKG